MNEGAAMDHLAKLERAYTAVVADALDQLGLRDRALDPAIRAQHDSKAVVGRALPVSVVRSEAIPDPPYEEWIRLIEAVQPGDAFVIAVEDGIVAATWGELFSCAALGRGARLTVSDGYIRDATLTAEVGFPVFARGCSPLDTLGRAMIASVGEDVRCGGVSVSRGDYVVADGDGVMAIPSGAVGDVLAIVEAKARLETGGRAELLAGASVREVWDRYGVF
jgi:4-hydroxy-4-methyl-2-oxoglutarate aldolase